MNAAARAASSGVNAPSFATGMRWAADAGQTQFTVTPKRPHSRAAVRVNDRIASFAAGPSSTTLPMKIFSSVRLGVSPEINALSTIMIGIVTVGVVTASLLSKRSIARQRAEEQAAVRTT